MAGRYPGGEPAAPAMWPAMPASAPALPHGYAYTPELPTVGSADPSRAHQGIPPLRPGHAAAAPTAHSYYPPPAASPYATAASPYATAASPYATAAAGVPPPSAVPGYPATYAPPPTTAAYDPHAAVHPHAAYPPQAAYPGYPAYAAAPPGYIAVPPEYASYYGVAAPGAAVAGSADAGTGQFHRDPTDLPRPGRAIFIGNLAATVNDEEVRQMAQVYGNIESLRVVPERHCAFVNFSDSSSAQSWKGASEAGTVFSLGGQTISINWAKERNQPAPGHHRKSTGQKPPSRAIYIGNLPDHTSEKEIEQLAAQFGTFESVRVLTSKKCAFVNFEREEDAVKMHNQHMTLPFMVGGSKITVGFAKAPADPMFRVKATGNPEASALPSPGTVAAPGSHNRFSNPPSRSVYLGKLGPETTINDVTMLAQPYGPIDSVKLMPEKLCVFVNFIHERSSIAMVNSPVAPMVNGKVVTMGFAKSQALSASLMSLIQSGATRNLHVSNVAATVTQATLVSLFSAIVPLEDVVVMAGKGFAFVNTASVTGATEAMNKMQGMELEGQAIRIAYAKEVAHRSRDSGGSTDFTQPLPTPNSAPLVDPVQPQMTAAVEPASITTLVAGTEGVADDNSEQPKKKIRVAD